MEGHPTPTAGTISGLPAGYKYSCIQFVVSHGSPAAPAVRAAGLCHAPGTGPPGRVPPGGEPDLRARLPQNIRTTAQERWRLIRAGLKLGLKLKPLISIVRYATFIGWVRNVETQRFVPRKAGRHRTPQDVRDLVIRLKRENGWGYIRILGELRKLGLQISRQTVKNIPVEAGLATGPDDDHDTWDAFLRRHAETLWQCDFVTKPMWTVKGLVDLYFLVFLHLGTRRVWISRDDQS